jgi:hypothetical protein
MIKSDKKALRGEPQDISEGWEPLENEDKSCGAQANPTAGGLCATSLQLLYDIARAEVRRYR